MISADNSWINRFSFTCGHHYVNHGRLIQISKVLKVYPFWNAIFVVGFLPEFESILKCSDRVFSDFNNLFLSVVVFSLVGRSFNLLHLRVTHSFNYRYILSKFLKSFFNLIKLHLSSWRLLNQYTTFGVLRRILLWIYLLHLTFYSIYGWEKLNHQFTLDRGTPYLCIH